MSWRATAEKPGQQHQSARALRSGQVSQQQAYGCLPRLCTQGPQLLPFSTHVYRGEFWWPSIAETKACHTYDLANLSFQKVFHIKQISHLYS